jgi:hypothetical protein
MERRSRDQRVWEAERSAAIPDLSTPLTGQHRRLAAGLNELGRDKKAIEQSLVRLSEPGSNLADDHFGHDRLITLFEHPLPPFASARVAS